MGGRAALAASLGLLVLAGCGGSRGDTTANAALSDANGIVLPDIAGDVTMDGAASSVGSCLDGTTLAESADDLAADVQAYGLAAYSAMGDDPDWAADVDCAEEHALEVYGIVTLPDDVDEQIDGYADLLDPTSPLGRDIAGAVTHECANLFEPAALVMAAAPLDVDVQPVVNTTSALDLTVQPLPPRDWAAGRRGFACLLSQDPAGTVRAADIVTAELPFADRICLDEHDFVGCDAPHDSERIALLIVDAAVAAHDLPGRRAVDDADRVDLGADRWSLLDEVCDRYLREISRTPAPGLVGVADTYPELYPNEAGSYQVICSARSPFGTPAKDVVSTTTSVFDM